MIGYLKNIGARALLVLLVLAGVPAIASAHVLKQDNGISAVLHVPPEDNPTAGEQTELNIAFGDEQNKFSLMNCNCQVLIQSEGKTLQTLPAQPALSGATLDSAVNTSFPKPGIYHVVVKGSAKNGAFRTFKLDFTLRVSADSASSSSKPSSEIVIISIGSLIILSMIAYTSISFGDRYKKSSPSTPIKRKFKE